MLFIVICMLSLSMLFFFFLTRSTPVIYTLSLHDALPICGAGRRSPALGALLHLARAGRPHPAASRRRAVRRDLRLVVFDGAVRAARRAAGHGLRGRRFGEVRPVRPGDAAADAVDLPAGGRAPAAVRA